MAKPNKNNRLGRGLSALLKDEPNVNSASDEGAKNLVGNILEIDLDKIVANPWQPRTKFDKQSMEDWLHQSNRWGLFSPLRYVKLHKERMN